VTSLNRIVLYRESKALIRALQPETLDVAEISGKFGERFTFRSYTQLRYPRYDICAGPIPDDAGKPMKFDLILANQVWEHLDRPYAATRNVYRMLRKGGHFWIAVPFMIPFHGAPVDCSRWSARGLKNLLIEGGFDPDEIRSFQWGNRHAARRNLEDSWPPEHDPATDDLENDPDFPILSWAIARRT
jgi:SAM-dependent methyltransferase